LKYKSKITPIFWKKRDLYREQFALAFNFLMALEEDRGCDELWLSTAVNAHLYKGNTFLAYICLPTPRVMTLSPHYNRTIYDFAVDCSDRLFPNIVREVLERHQADGARWWSSLSNDQFKLENGTPEIVFAELLEKIRSLPSVADTCSIRPHRLDGTMPCEPRND
jgi:hypothetical protein